MKHIFLFALTSLILVGCSCNPDKTPENAKQSEAPVAETSAVVDANVDESKDSVAENKDEVKADEAKADDSQKKKDGTIEKVIASEENGVRIDVHYPEFGVSAIDTVLENKAKKYVNENKARLEKQRKDYPDEMIPFYEYGMTYEVVRSSSDSADIVLSHNEYTGGAHGMTALETVMLDKDGNEIDPWSLFENVDEELPKMSEEARRQLKEKLSDFEDIEMMIDSGTEPKRENFRNMVRTDKGVRIYFDPYSVAPWAAGILYIDYDMP